MRKKLIISIALVLLLIAPAFALEIKEPINNQLLTNTHDINLVLNLTTENVTTTSCLYELMYNNTYTTGNISVSCKGGVMSFLSTGKNLIKAYSINSTDNTTLNYVNATVLIKRQEGNMNIFMILSFISLVGFFIYLLVKSIEKLALIDFNIKWLIYNWIYFFSLIVFKYFYSEFIKYGFIDVLQDFIYIGAITHIIFPTIAFISSFLINRLRLKNDLIQNG